MAFWGENFGMNEPEFLKNMFGPAGAGATPGGPPPGSAGNPQWDAWHAKTAALNRADRVARFGEEAVAAMEAAGAKAPNMAMPNATYNPEAEAAAAARRAATGGAVGAEAGIGAAAPSAAGFFAKNLPWLSKTAGPIGYGAVPAMEAKTVYDVATNPKTTGLDVGTAVAQGVSRSAGMAAGAMLGAKVPGPLWLRVGAGLLAGAAGYAIPNLFVGQTPGTTPTTPKPAVTQPAAAPVVPPVTGVIQSANPVEPVRDPGVVPDNVMAEYRARQAMGGGAREVPIGHNAFGIDTGAVRTNTVSPVSGVRKPDGSIEYLYSNFNGGARPSVAPSAPSTYTEGPGGVPINPATGTPYSKMMPQNYSIVDMAQARGAEKNILAQHLANQAITLQTMKENAQERTAFIRQQAALKMAPNAQGGTDIVNEIAGTVTTRDPTTGKLVVEKLAESKGPPTEANIRKMAATLKQANLSASKADLMRTIEKQYPGVTINPNWIPG